jgi:hypothetical protein
MNHLPYNCLQYIIFRVSGDVESIFAVHFFIKALFKKIEVKFKS